MEYGKERQHGTSKTGRPRMRCWNAVTIQRKNGSRGTRNDLATQKELSVFTQSDYDDDKHECQLL
jgi:hypothetical protein